jgi:dihydrofolate synthase/folylpolyglutamate synthase
MEQMLLHLQQLRFHRLHIVLGMVKDKDIDQTLSLFPQNASYYFTQAHIPRALDAEILRDKAAAFSLEGHSYPDVNTALNKALEQASAEDLIIVCGSIFLVAEVAVDRF